MVITSSPLSRAVNRRRPRAARARAARARAARARAARARGRHAIGPPHTRSGINALAEHALRVHARDRAPCAPAVRGRARRVERRAYRGGEREHVLMIAELLHQRVLQLDDRLCLVADRLPADRWLGGAARLARPDDRSRRPSGPPPELGASRAAGRGSGVALRLRFMTRAQELGGKSATQMAVAQEFCIIFSTVFDLWN